MSSLNLPRFTEPITHYWQEILPSTALTKQPPYQYSVPVTLPDTRILNLPIRQLPHDPTQAVASLIINQASVPVVQTLGEMLAEKIRPYKPDIIIGLPTLGLTLAPIVALSLGQERYIPMGYSKKFWYASDLSTAVSSITSPDEKRVYLDPHLLPLIRGKRVAIVDDAVSSGSTLAAVWDLLEGLCEICVCGVVMVQGRKWEMAVGEKRARMIASVFESPLLRAVEGGWNMRN